MSLADLAADWLPIRLHWHAGGPVVDWCCVGRNSFDAPFFEDTIARCFREPFRAVFCQRTPIDTAEALADSHPGLPLAGLVFHASRCGSTLLGRALMASPEHLVLAEPPPFDDVLNTSTRGAADPQRLRWLRAITAALSQPRRSTERHAVIKLDSWHLHDAPLIRRAFPDTPWIALYRDPLEILVSHQRAAGLHMVPGQIATERLGLDPSAAQLPLAEFQARVLARLYEAAAAAAERYGARLINYRQLPEALWRDALPLFGCRPDAGATAEIGRRLAYDAKHPAERFAPDSQRKQDIATPATRELAERLVGPAYQRLEALRAAQECTRPTQP